MIIRQLGSVAAGVAAGGLLWGCATAPPPRVKDGELPVPADYKT